MIFSYLLDAENIQSSIQLWGTHPTQQEKTMNKPTMHKKFHERCYISNLILISEFVWTTSIQICQKIHDIFQQLDKDFEEPSKDGAFCWPGLWPGSCRLENIKLVKIIQFINCYGDIGKYGAFSLMKWLSTMDDSGVLDVGYRMSQISKLTSPY